MIIMKMSWMRQKSVRGINLLIFNEWFEKVKCLKTKNAVRSLLMMKNAGYILFMQFDYITAKKMQVQTRMKRQTLQWRIYLMRHALGILNEQLSSLGAVLSASGWVKPGRVSAGCSCSLPWLTDSTSGGTDVSISIQACAARVWACVGWLTQCLGLGPPQSFFCCQAQLWAVLCSVGWKVCAVHALIINTYIKIDLRAPRVPQTFEHKSDCPRAMHLANAHPSEVWARNYLQSYQRLLFAWVGRPSEGKTFPLTASYCLCFDIISAALISSFAHANTFPTSVPFNFQLVSLQENIDKGLLHFLPFLSSPDNFL